MSGAEAFRTAVEAADAEALVATLAEDVVFRSPALSNAASARTSSTSSP